MNLSKMLKSVYSTGDSMTVLELLKKLIEAVEEYELSGTGTHLYKHTLTVISNEGNKQTVVVNNSSTPIETTANTDDIYGAIPEVPAIVLEDDVELII